MQDKLTQINLSPAVAGDGKLPPALLDTGLSLYSNVMNAVDRLEDGLKVRNRGIILEAHAAITGTIRLVQEQLCHEYRNVRSDRKTPDLWSVLCSSGNFGRPFQHEFCPECVFFDTNNSRVFSEEHARALIRSKSQGVCASA